jgi:hypothetical protein
MSDIRDEAQALEALEMLIDPDCPPGLAARDLARAVINLVRDQDGTDAIRIAIELDRIAAELGRPRRA